MMIDKEWLAGLKVGDEVMVRWSCGDLPCESNGKVIRIGLRQVHILCHGAGEAITFNRKDGLRFPRAAWSYNDWRIEKC